MTDYWTLACDTENLTEVCKLSVNVAYEDDRTIQMQHGFFVGQGCFSLFARDYSLYNHRDISFCRLQPGFLQPIDHFS